MRLRKRACRPKRTSLAIAGVKVLKDPEQPSRAMKVHPSQVKEANEAAAKMGCGAPYRRDGMCVLRRRKMKKYIEEINRRRGEGEARMVNFDGGYGDPI